MQEVAIQTGISLTFLIKRSKNLGEKQDKTIGHYFLLSRRDWGETEF